jgi:hypothetical protein
VSDRAGEVLDQGDWLRRAAGPEPADLERRRGWWTEREEAWRLGAPELATLGAADPLPEGAHDRAQTFLPQAVLVRDCHHLLRGWFGPALDDLGVELGSGALARARSWLEARRRLRLVGDSPAALLTRLGDPLAARDLLFELFAPSRHGAALSRYPAAFAALSKALPERSGLRGWDAGCATGEGTWELAHVLAGRGGAWAVVGTTPCPMELLMARRRGRPHDHERSAALESFVRQHELADGVEFERGDVLVEPPEQGAFDVVMCAGLLGGDVPVGLIRQALGVLFAGLAPGGLLCLADRFREDVARDARRVVRLELHDRGLRELCTEPAWSLYRR